MAAMLKIMRRVSAAGAWVPILSRAPSAHEVVLSFDDGPSPATTPAILDLLAAHGATAAFFLAGQRVKAHPALAAAIADAGHEIYSHGYSHVRMDRLSDAEIVAEMERTEALLAPIRPTPHPYLLRLPYGSGHGDARVHRVLRGWRPDVQIVHWRYSFLDWTLADGCEGEANVAARCGVAVARARRSKHFPGSIALLHEDPFDAASPLAVRIAPLLLARTLAMMAEQGLRTGRLAARERVGRMGRHLRLARLRA